MLLWWKEIGEHKLSDSKYIQIFKKLKNDRLNFTVLQRGGKMPWTYLCSVISSCINGVKPCTVDIGNSEKCFESKLKKQTYNYKTILLCVIHCHISNKNGLKFKLCDFDNLMKKTHTLNSIDNFWVFLWHLLQAEFSLKTTPQQQPL